MWRRVLVSLLLAAGVLSATAIPTTLPSSVRGPEAVRAYAGLVAELASQRMEGRGPGSRGIELARDLLAEHFKALGLKPAFGESYLQPLQIRTGVKVKEQALALLDGPGKAVTADAKREFTVLGFSRNGEFQGPAVFAGYGVVNPKKKYDSYAGLERDSLAGKVVIAYRFEPQDETGRSLWGGRYGRYRTWSAAASLINKARWAARHGAAALLVVNPPSHSRPPALRTTAGTAFGIQARIPVIQISPGLFKKLLRRAGRADAAAAMKALQAAADAGKGKPFELDGVILRGRVELEPVRAKVENVAAVLPGAGDLAKEYVVLGAHYDHVGYSGFGSRSRKRAVHFGADDNASGTAGVLMLAKWFSDRAAGRDVLPGVPKQRRTLVFVGFTGEERGLLGSRHFVSHGKDLGIEVDRIAALINLDMIGRLRDRKLYIWGVQSGDRWREIVDAAVAGSGLDVKTGGLGVGPGDQMSFYRKKIPVLTFFTGPHKEYHTPGDTADKINAAGAIEVLAVADAVLAELWAGPKRIAYKPPKPGAGRRAMAMAGDAYLGVAPEVLSAAEDGCEIVEVVADGPAAKAGLKAGDVIVAWDGRPIAGLGQMLVALHGSRPGQKVTLKLRRGTGTIELKVTLGRR